MKTLLLQTSFTINELLCVEPRNCSFIRGNNCGWRSSGSSSSFVWRPPPSYGSLLKNVTGEAGEVYDQLRNTTVISLFLLFLVLGYITYRRYWRSSAHRDKDFVVLWHPTTLSKGHRCFVFHYAMEKAMKDHAGWGFVVRVKVNERIYSEMVPTNASGEWQLGKLQLPQQEGTPMKIEFLACTECYVALDNFIFTLQPCNMGTSCTTVYIYNFT